MKKAVFLIIAIAAALLLCACAGIGQDPSTSDSTSGTTKAHQHEFGEWKTVKAATCTEYGEEERVCTCGEKETQSIEPGHTIVLDEAKAATCAETGLSEGYHCSVCNTVLRAPTVIEKTSHKIVNNECTECHVSASNGLKMEYVRTSYGYSVVGYGECTDSVLIIPSDYQGSPVISIGEEAFAGSYNLEYVYLPETIKYVEKDAFFSCTNLKGVYFAGNVKNIVSNAFNSCTSLRFINVPEEISLPSASMSSSAIYPFYNCDYFKTIYYGGTMDQWTEHMYSHRFDSKEKTFTIYCTDGTITLSSFYESRSTQ